MKDYKIDNHERAVSVLKNNGFQLRAQPYGYLIRPSEPQAGYPTRIKVESIEHWKFRIADRPSECADLLMPDSGAGIGFLRLCPCDNPVMAEYQNKLLETLGLNPASDA